MEPLSIDTVDCTRRHLTLLEEDGLKVYSAKNLKENEVILGGAASEEMFPKKTESEKKAFSYPLWHCRLRLALWVKSSVSYLGASDKHLKESVVKAKGNSISK